MPRGGFQRVRPPSREQQYLAQQAPQRDPTSGVTTFAGGQAQTTGQVANLGGGKFGVTGAPGAVGDTSPNYYDDPTVNQFAELPSLAEAMAYKKSKPTFHGVQRPGDYQRVVQREMANEASGGQLNQLIENRVENARAARGDTTASPFAVARAMGGFHGVRGGDLDVELLKRVRGMGGVV